jgi:hypothetical protein
MTRSADEIEAISRQAHIERSYKRAGREFGCHENIAKDTNTLTSNYRLDCMQVFPKTQVFHVLELGHVAPPASGNTEPPLPGRSPEI